MHFQQSKDRIYIRDEEGNEYSETYANAEADGMTIPEMDEQYDYRIYEHNKDGSFKRHALIADHGTLHHGGDEGWQPALDAFSDVAELLRRKTAREKAIEDARLQAEQDRIDAQNKAAEERNAKLLADYTDQG